MKQHMSFLKYKSPIIAGDRRRSQDCYRKFGIKRFVVKAHWASRLHYDLRLEMDGVAKSWAIPKEPLLEPGMRRLAIQVADHTTEDMEHEDLSKERSLKSGRVETWDNGTYELLERDEDKFVLRFNGERLKGLYGIIRIKRWKGNNWLLVKAEGNLK